MEILEEIQDLVMVYANILSQILKIDVTIVDRKFKRIAGSGQLIKEINEDMSKEGHIMKKVMEEGKTHIVEMPGQSEICKDCETKDRCRETFHMSTPIMDNKKAIGVICFTCFNQRQRNHALKNQEVFKQFMQQFADLISAKVAEVRDYKKNLSMKDLLENIVERLDAGVLVLDRYHNVIQTNAMCCHILKLPESKLFTMPVRILPTGNQIDQLNEYDMTVGSSSYSLVGKIFELDGKTGQTFFLFSQAERTIKNSIGLSRKKKCVGIERIEETSLVIQAIKQEILQVMNSPSPVLIWGERGTDRKKYAIAIHEEGERSKEIVCHVNCEVIPKEQLEQELFGVVKTRTEKGKVGKLETASKGTLILEEVENLPYEVQRKLGKFIDDHLVIRQGSNRGVKVNTRIICTTSADLLDLVKQGRMLPDLYYRINILPLHIPPLRENKGDIYFLAQKYLQQYSKTMNKEVKYITDEFFTSISQYDWPGNKLELKSTMEYVVNMMKIDGKIDIDLLPRHLRWGSVRLHTEESFNLEEMEKNMIQKAINYYGTNVEAKRKIAEALGISMATLYRKLDKYRLKL